uniref:RRM domain-containing protein n=1 Tax=Plectus sambesii TaxID=2011161 RepID=A0A914UPV2_9BILA
MENAYDRRERTIYVSGMHRSVTEEHLYDLFQKAGPIEKVILKENQDGSPQHALVVFKNVDSVMYSIAYLQATQIGDLSINIRPL